MKVAIIGGGISGIITSIGLSENGHEVHLFEKTSSLGGRIKSKENKELFSMLAFMYFTQVTLQ